MKIMQIERELIANLNWLKNSILTRDKRFDEYYKTLSCISQELALIYHDRLSDDEREMVNYTGTEKIEQSKNMNDPFLIKIKDLEQDNFVFYNDEKIGLEFFFRVLSFDGIEAKFMEVCSGNVYSVEFSDTNDYILLYTDTTRFIESVIKEVKPMSTEIEFLNNITKVNYRNITTHLP